MAQQWPDPSQLDEALVFAAVAEQSSFTKAAALLNRDATILSRRVSALEQRLGVRLLERTTRKVTLTEVGAAFLARIRPGLAALSEAEAEAMAHANGEPQGHLRLALPSAFGRLWIAPLLPDFMARYPKVKIEAMFSNRFADLVGDGFDAAIRIGALPDSALIVRKIAPHRRLLCAAPDYLDRHGVPERPEDLVRHTCLGFTGFNSYPNWHFTRRADGERMTVHIEAPLVTDDAEALVEAAVRGVGIMMCTEWLVGHQLSRRQLLPLLRDWSLEDEGAIHIVVPSNRQLAGKTRAFVDWIVAYFTPIPPWRLSSDDTGDKPIS
ncbi:MAG: LysR family transcriptional regulator [Pseudomonadota bacterium]